MEEPPNKDRVHVVVEHRVATRTNALAIISLVLAIVGIVLTWFVPILTQVAAIICGHIARSQIRQRQGQETGDGMALAGLIIGYIMLGLYILFFIILGVGLGLLGVIFSNLE